MGPRGVESIKRYRGEETEEEQKVPGNVATSLAREGKGIRREGPGNTKFKGCLQEGVKRHQEMV